MIMPLILHQTPYYQYSYDSFYLITYIFYSPKNNALPLTTKSSGSAFPTLTLTSVNNLSLVVEK